jgi:predicted amidohydrolase YtcJ
VPAQKISLEDALRSYTANGAYAFFEEELKGSLEVGKLADFVLLDEDLDAIAPEAIKNVRVLQTVVGGQVVYPGDE